MLRPNLIIWPWGLMTCISWDIPQIEILLGAHVHNRSWGISFKFWWNVYGNLKHNKTRMMMVDVDDNGDDKVKTIELTFYSCSCCFSSSRKEPKQIQRRWLKKHVTNLQEESPKCLSLPLGNWEAYPEPEELFRMRSAGYWRRVLESRFFDYNSRENTRWNE